MKPADPGHTQEGRRSADPLVGDRTEQPRRKAMAGMDFAESVLCVGLQTSFSNRTRQVTGKRLCKGPKRIVFVHIFSYTSNSELRMGNTSYPSTCERARIKHIYSYRRTQGAP
jgi:hypothetical protein